MTKQRRARGHIKAQGKNSWSIIVYQDGKHRWFTFHGSRPDAEKFLTAKLKEKDDKKLVSTARETMGQFLQRWLDEYCKIYIEANSRITYELAVKKHFIPAFGNTQLRNFKPEHMRKFIADNSTNLSGTSLKAYFYILHKALETARRDWQLIPTNPLDDVKAPERSHFEGKVLPPDKLDALFEYLQRRPVYYAMIFMDIFSGLRRNELCGLKWEDVDLDLGEIRINRGYHLLPDNTGLIKAPKRKSQRTVPLTKATVMVLKDYKQKMLTLTDNKLKPGDPVFPKITSKGLLYKRPNTITQYWILTRNKLELEGVRLHDLRHTFASYLIKQGVHIKVVQELLGHSVIATTADIYSHMMPGMQRDAVDKLDAIR